MFSSIDQTGPVVGGLGGVIGVVGVMLIVTVIIIVIMIVVWNKKVGWSYMG